MVNILYGAKYRFMSQWFKSGLWSRIILMRLRLRFLFLAIMAPAPAPAPSMCKTNLLCKEKNNHVLSREIVT